MLKNFAEKFAEVEPTNQPRVKKTVKLGFQAKNHIVSKSKPKIFAQNSHERPHTNTPAYFEHDPKVIYAGIFFLF